LAEVVAKGCTQDELAFFLQVAKLKRLDPFTGQIHVVKRWDSMAGKEKIVIQTGIDGYRTIASRTGDLAGSDDPEYDTDTEEHPNWAKVTVYRYGRGDEKVPYKATARWGEYVQRKKDGEPNRMWKTMPYLMLGKVAEALALRKAFPDELSGMYTNEEMEQADSEGVTPASITKPQVSMPKSTDEKKPQTQQRESKEADTSTHGKTTTTQTSTAGGNAAATEPEKLSGEITQVTPGKNGVLVLAVNGKVVVVPGKHSSDDFVVGAKILCSVIQSKIKGQVVLEVSEVEMVMPPAVEGEIVDAEFTEVDEKPQEKKPDPFVESMRGVFEEDAPKAAQASPAPAAAGEATKPGTAGLKRGQRLHTLITQNHKNTGFTEDHLKKYLATQRLEHARDLACPPKGSDAFNAYEYACSMAVGEVDWHEILED